MNGLDAIEKMTPEKRELLFSELQKSLSGEYGGIDNLGRRIQKDATNNIGVTIGLGCSAPRWRPRRSSSIPSRPRSATGSRGASSAGTG